MNKIKLIPFLLFIFFLILVFICGGCFDAYSMSDELRRLEMENNDLWNKIDELEKEIEELEEELYLMASDIDILLDYSEYIANHFGFDSEAPYLVESDYWFHLMVRR